jgi:CHAD domain-containing protein
LVRKLGDLASATNPGRDAEVQLAWLAPLAETVRPVERPGVGALLRQLEERRDDCYRKVEREIVRDFGELAAALGEKLVGYRVELRLDRPAKAATFAVATRAAAGRAADELRDRLGRLRSVTDEEEGHEARIAAKRLRYVVEPMAPWSPESEAPVARLKRLQDLLGELHDGQLLAAHVAASLAEIESRRAQELVEATLDAAAPAAGDPDDATAGSPSRRARRPRSRAGLLAVARALGARRTELFAAISAGWLDGDRPELAALEAELARFDERLAAPAKSWRSGRRRRD